MIDVAYGFSSRLARVAATEVKAWPGNGIIVMAYSYGRAMAFVVDWRRVSSEPKKHLTPVGLCFLTFGLKDATGDLVLVPVRCGKMDGWVLS